MRNLNVKTVIAALLAALAAITTPALAADHYLLDPNHTTVMFSVNHMGFSKVYGRFDKVEGAFTLDQAAPEKSSVVVTIDAASIDTNQAKRDDHLRSKDFFEAAAFPQLIFKSTSVKKTGEKTATMTGDLTLHGVTKPVSLSVTLTGAGPHPVDQTKTIAGFSARGTLKRSDFGMTYGVPVVGDEIELIIETESIRQL